jgi:hypothetical protein
MRGMKIICQINLYATRLAEEEAKKPSRRAFLTSMLVAVVLGLSWLGLQLTVIHLQQESATTHELELDASRELAAARLQAQEDAKKSERRKRVQDYFLSRLCVAPLLEQLFTAVPANVELSHVRWKALEDGECEVRIAGRAAGASPRIECDKCRLLLVSKFGAAGFTASAQFDSLEDSADKIHVGDADVPAAEFVLILKIQKGKHEQRKT